MKNNPNEIRIGPITRARAKLIEQQVNSLLIDSDVLLGEDFILPKSLYVCMIRYHDKGKDPERGEEEDCSNFRSPTHFGRPTLLTMTAASLYRRPQAEDGLLRGFGRPTHRTSEMRRTSDMQIFVLFNLHDFATTLLTRRHNPSSDVQHVSDVRRDGRPKPVGIL